MCVCVCVCVCICIYVYIYIYIRLNVDSLDLYIFINEFSAPLPNTHKHLCKVHWWYRDRIATDNLIL